MKIAVTFLLVSTMALMSHQQRFQPFANLHLPWFNRPEPSIRDLYDYLYARSLLQSVNAAPAPHLVSNMRLSQGAQPELNANQWPDVESRSAAIVPDIESSVGAIDDTPANPRVFLNYVTTAGGTSSYFNPFLKTIYYITSSTATSTIVKSCVPATAFKAGSSTVTCRKKRRDLMASLLDKAVILFNDEPTPTKVLPMEVSAIARSLPLTDEPAIVAIDLSSSKSDDYAEAPSHFQLEEPAVREKRLFLAASTTITSYVFVSTTSTKTLSSLGVTLECIPSTFALC